MSSDSICRSCVIKNVKMFRLNNELQEIYEKLTSTKVSLEDGMPKNICFICYSHLKRCKKFSEVALRSQLLLRDRLDSGDNISQDHPSNLLSLQVVKNLSVTVAESGHHSTINYPPEVNRNYICVTDDPIKVKIEVEEEESIKQEIVNIKTERIDFEFDENDTDKLGTTNEESTNCEPKDTSVNTIGLFPQKLSKPFSCRKCSKAFFMSKNLIEHMKECFVEEDLTCNICNLTFTNIGILKSHSLEHTNEQPFVCDRCSQGFKTIADLSAHIRIHNAEKKFTCDICGKAFTLVTNFKTHMALHEGTKKFVCGVCGKAFYTNGNLKAHTRCHTGERPFQCNTCGLTFGFKCSLKQHIRRLHTEVKPFPCDQCHLSFNQEVALTSHLRFHNSDKLYQCEICNKTFTTTRILKGHMDVHSDQRPFRCVKCGKGFKRPEHLKMHLKTLKCKDNTDSN